MRRPSEAQLAKLFAIGRGDLAAKYRTALTPLATFQPRPDDPEDYDQQTAFVNSRAKFAVCLGGNRSGKTIAAAYKTACYLRDTPPPRELTPFWVLGETFEQTCAVCWDERLSTFIPPETILHTDWYNVKRRWPRAVLLKHPTREGKPGWIIEFKSYDQGVQLMQGRSIGGYWFNEECPLSLVHEVQIRVADYDAPGWADFTPIHIRDPQWADLYDDPPDGWEFFHLNVHRNRFKGIDRWAARHFGPGSAVPEEERRTREVGVFASFHGMVYKEFQRSIHVLDPETTKDPYLRDIAMKLDMEATRQSKQPIGIPDSWKRIRGIDFGWSNPTAVLWIAKDQDGRYYVYDEHYEAQQPIEYTAARIKERWWDYEQDKVWTRTYCDSEDPAAINKLRTLSGSDSFVPVDKSAARVGRQISVLRSLMMVAGDGRPRLYILSKCKNLIRELRGYRWSEATGKPGKNQKNPVDIPVAWNDHALDALRYAIFHDLNVGSVTPTNVRQGIQHREGVKLSGGRR